MMTGQPGGQGKGNHGRGEREGFKTDNIDQSAFRDIVNAKMRVIHLSTTSAGTLMEIPGVSIDIPLTQRSDKNTVLFQYVGKLC